MHPRYSENTQEVETVNGEGANISDNDEDLAVDGFGGGVVEDEEESENDSEGDSEAESSESESEEENKDDQNEESDDDANGENDEEDNQFEIEVRAKMPKKCFRIAIMVINFFIVHSERKHILPRIQINLKCSMNLSRQ